jgi:hypothetical protein
MSQVSNFAKKTLQFVRFPYVIALHILPSIAVRNQNSKNLTNYVVFLAKLQTWFNQEIVQLPYQRYLVCVFAKIKLYSNEQGETFQTN